MPHIYPVEGGIPVTIDGQCVRAIGGAGVPPHVDAAIADAGLKAIDHTGWAMSATSQST